MTKLAYHRDPRLTTVHTEVLEQLEARASAWNAERQDEDIEADLLLHIGGVGDELVCWIETVVMVFQHLLAVECIYCIEDFFFCEFDGPRSRRVIVQIRGE